MKRINSLMIEGIVFLLAGIGLLCYCISSNAKIMQQYWSISPYMLPTIIALLMIVMSIVLFFQGITLRKQSESGTQATPEKVPIDWKGIASSLVLMIAYYILLPLIHFLPATAVFLFCFLLLLGERSKVLLVLVPVLTSVFLYLLFGVALSLLLP